MDGIMRTLWDESADLNDESMLTRSVLSDDYTANDKERLQDLKADAAEDMENVEGSFKVEGDNKTEEK